MENGPEIKSRYRRTDNASDILWQPDHSLPYVIHSAGHPLDGEVVIWPEILRGPDGMQTLFYITNREHVFGGSLQNDSESDGVVRVSPSVQFMQEDGYGSPAELLISVMSDAEFEKYRDSYKSKEDLMNSFIGGLDD